MTLAQQAVVQNQIEQIFANWFVKAVDDAIRENVEISESVGMETVVIREYDGVGVHDGKTPCQWCLDRAGSWSYEDAQANGVWERHEGCGCTITYKTKKGDIQRLRGLSGVWEEVRR